MALLSQARIVEIATAFLELDLSVAQVRPALLTGLPLHFKGGMQGNLPDLPQLMLDLGRMNQFERLAGGVVPLQVWLTNALPLAVGTEQERVLRAALDDVEHAASGAPRLDPAALPETQEAIVHRDDMLPLSFLELGIEAARSVARLRVPSHQGGQPRMVMQAPEIHLGTGWLLTPTLLMTNHHVVNARKEGEAPSADDDLRLQGAACGVQFGFDAEGMEGVTVLAAGLEAWDPGLDYAVLRVPDTGRPALRRAAAPVAPAAGVHVAVNILQHPEGAAKKLGIRNNLVTASTATDLRYFTDTKAGSSGSPVMNDVWEVVALHRGATYAENVNFQGKTVAYVNVGTHLAAILQDLRARYPELAGEIG